MRIVFCDDDQQVLVQLKKYLSEYFQTNHLLQPEYAGYTSGEELLEKEQRPEIAFLDVEMPGLSGIHVGAKLKQRNPYAKVFILTSFPDYLDEAMKFHVFRYLSKPLDKKRLFRNMKDALYQYSVDTCPVAIETKEKSIVCYADEIIMVEAADKNAVVHTIQASYETTQPIKYWEKLLEIGSFYQPYRSFIINMRYVNSYSKNAIALVPPRGVGYTAYLSRRKYKDFKNAHLLYLEAMK